MPDMDLRENAATCGIVAAAEAVQAGQEQGLSREEIAGDAHRAAELAYQAYLAMAQHADLDDQHASGGPVVVRRPAPHEPAGGDIVECPPGYHEDAAHHCTPNVGAPMVVGHHGGGGGHGGHGHHDHLLLGGGWGGDYWSPVVLACGPGQLLLADGTCFPPAAYGYHVGEVNVGDPIGATFLAADEDGFVTMPDGSTVHVDSIELGNVASVGAALVGQGADHARRVGRVGQLDPYTGGSSMPAAGATGTTASSSPEADAIEGNWVAVMQARSSIPGWTAANTKKLQSDHSNWEAFYAHVKNGETLYMLQDVTPWQTIVDEWGDAMRAMAPNKQDWPADFPTTPGGAGLSTTPLQVPSLPDASGIASALQWGVIAIAVGVGLWLFWPVLAGAKGVLAAL
jgi:hypothetical protein